MNPLPHMLLKLSAVTQILKVRLMRFIGLQNVPDR